MLVATDVAARGLDVKDIQYVINYDFPVDGVEVSEARPKWFGCLLSTHVQGMSLQLQSFAMSCSGGAVWNALTE